MIKGWEKKYSEILRNFKYNKERDRESAKTLRKIITKSTPKSHLKRLIFKKTVFVIGAGPSLSSSIPILKKYNVTKIAADSATKALLKNKITPDIVLTDLDGDIITLKKMGRTKSIMVVHAHGDNQKKLNLVKKFKNCIGTTQTNPLKNIHNFGGFTDGDRAVFMASHFKAKKIILFGMDFGTKIGKYSKTNTNDKKIKLKKLQYGKKLLEWLASKSDSKLYTTSKPIKGFRKIRYNDLDTIVL